MRRPNKNDWGPIFPVPLGKASIGLLHGTLAMNLPAFEKKKRPGLTSSRLPGRIIIPIIINTLGGPHNKLATESQSSRRLFKPQARGLTRIPSERYAKLKENFSPLYWLRKHHRRGLVITLYTALSTFKGVNFLFCCFQRWRPRLSSVWPPSITRWKPHQSSCVNHG